ncbi:MAG: hypothetical protein Kow0081_1990 [Candidatus Dojkabacteria bacterium]
MNQHEIFMNKKVMYFDVETTGINPYLHEIIQIGIIIEINGEVVDQLNLKCQPTNWDVISPEALKITGNTIESLKKEMPAAEAYKKVDALLCKYIDQYDKTDKYYPAGYNVRFDLDFLGEFYRRNNNPYLGSIINWRYLDPLPMLYALDFKGKIKFPNYKLTTIAEVLKIPLQAHDAFSDILATREIIRFLISGKLKDINKDISKNKRKKNKKKQEEDQHQLELFK